MRGYSMPVRVTTHGNDLTVTNTYQDSWHTWHIWFVAHWCQQLPRQPSFSYWVSVPCHGKFVLQCSRWFAGSFSCVFLHLETLHMQLGRKWRYIGYARPEHVIVSKPVSLPLRFHCCESAGHHRCCQFAANVCSKTDDARPYIWPVCCGVPILRPYQDHRRINCTDILRCTMTPCMPRMVHACAQMGTAVHHPYLLHVDASLGGGSLLCWFVSLYTTSAACTRAGSSLLFVYGLSAAQ
jgi:hypothetical protein